MSARRTAFALVALATTLACSPEAPPPVLPGPTTATPADLRPTTPIAAPAAAVRVAMKSPDSRVVAIRIVFAAGSADDPPGKEGLTRLTATTMAEGGTQALTYAELASKLYPMAAAIAVSVDRDETVFSATVPRGVVAEFYPLLRDVILAPRFAPDAVTRLRARQASELVSDLRGANDEALGKEALASMLYEGHPYGHPTQGTERGLASITLDDVRAHHASAFCKERVTFGVAGGYPDGFDDTIAADVARLPACAGERAKLPDPPARHGQQVLVVDKPGAGASAISIGFTTPITRADAAEYPALLFATDALGIHRQQAGRLFHELREKRGLNYGDYAYSEFFEQDGYGRFPSPNVARRQQFVSLWLRPVKRANTTFALRAALHVYAKLATEGMTDDDFARTKEFLTRLVGLEQQTDSRRLGYAIDDRTYGLDAPYVDAMRRGWTSLDAAKLKAFLAKTFDTKDLSIAIVASNGRAIADELVKGDPSATPAYDSPKPADVQAEDKEIARFPMALDAKSVRVVSVADLFK